MPQTYRIGVLVPLHEEYQYLTELAQPAETVRAEGDFYYQLVPPDYSEPVIVQVLEDMGLVRAAVAAERLIVRFGVDIVALLGIAGALDRNLLLGDVVIASEVDHYQYAAKATATLDGSPSIEQAGMHWRASHSVLEIVRSFSLRPETRATYNTWRDITSSRRPTIASPQIAAMMRDRPINAVGPIASGDFVGAAAWFRDAVLRRNRKLMALEMEGAGVSAAVTDRSDPKHFIIVRGLSDFADERKAELDRASATGVVDSGVLRRYAVLSAAEFLLRLVPVLLEDLGESEPVSSSEATGLSLARIAATSRPQASTVSQNAACGDPAGDHSSLEQDLEYEFATKYHKEASIRRLLHHANVRWQTISLNDSPVDVWFEAIQLAKNQGKLCALLRLAAKDYPGSDTFINALSYYRCS